jgi:hypothetical protein
MSCRRRPAKKGTKLLHPAAARFFFSHHHLAHRGARCPGGSGQMGPPDSPSCGPPRCAVRHQRALLKDTTGQLPMLRKRRRLPCRSWRSSPRAHLLRRARRGCPASRLSSAWVPECAPRAPSHEHPAPPRRRLSFGGERPLIASLCPPRCVARVQGTRVRLRFWALAAAARIGDAPSALRDAQR